MNILELFAGKQCFSNVAREMSFTTFTSDINPLPGIDYVIDILDFDVTKVPFIPDVIWASPDCAVWSKAAGKLHFDSKSLIPKTDKAVKAFLIIDKTIEILDYFLSINKNLKFYVENPQGKLQKYLQVGSLFGKLPRMVVIDQCQYGRNYQKTSHIFTNDFDWIPKARCQGRPICSHEKNIKNAGTGMKSSLGNLANHSYYERAKIPYDLCDEILKHNSFLMKISNIYIPL